MSLLLWCSFLLFQEGTDNQRILAESVFEVKRFGLVLEDPEAIALLGYAEEPLVFHLAYDGALTPDMRLQAAVVGPGISTPITINQPAEPLQIAIDRHVFTQVGTFRLVNVRLTANNQTLELATPSDAQITVVDDLFVSQVEVREISQQELIEKGYLFKKTDFHAVNFNLSLVLGSKKETVSIDALFPRTEEGAFKPVIIQDPFKPFVKPVFFNFGYKTDDPWSPREKPGANYRPDGILLIPGNINFLKSHFSVTALLLNTAPDALNVRMERLRARLVLPEAGPAGLPVTTNQELRQDMHHPGADGQLGTADDRSAIYSGEKASSEFIVIGNLEGAYPIEVEITGDMVLPQGIEKIQSNSQGMVYVKGQDYSVVFEHPDAVEENEPYDLVMYLRNTGPSLLEGAVQLDPFKLVGTRLAAGQDPQLAFSVGPEGEQALVWHMVATTSGKVLTTYFKGDGVAGIQLRVAVGASGESISPVVFSYPPQFYLLPASLTPDLKFWVKKSIDFSQTPPAKLPSELLPISASVPRELNRQMARIGQSVSWGLPQDVALFQLFELWLGGKDAYLPLDQLRRFYEQSNGLGGAWSSEMSSVFANQNPDQWLTRLAQNFSGCPQSVGFAVQADQSISLTIRDAEGRTHDSNGSRQIPFSSLLDLGNNRYFFWSAHMDATPIIQIESQSPATLQIASVFPDTNLNCVLAKTNLAAVQSVSLGLNPDSRTLTVQMPRQPAQSVQASAIAPLPFALSSVRQVDPKLDKNADAFGRTLLFQFSAPLDLSSLDPIEDHIRINGKPATDAVLQADGRNLFVSSRTPLGPYRPIHFELIGARDLHGQSLGTLNGNFDGSSWFIGVTIQGRVVDQQKDVSGGQVFLMVRKSDGPTSEFPIYQTETLSSDGTFSMDFAPLLTNSEEGDALFSTALKIGVLLPDGRYKEQIFSPQGAGQNLLAEFSFNFEGEVTGTVFAEGQPVPFAEVFLKHNNNPLANEIVQANAEGVFRFRNVEVGPISLKASANGVFAYGNGYLTSGNSPLQIDLFTSTETGGISGHIMIETESETLPVVGAIVGFARFGDQVQYMQPFGILVPFQVYGFVGDDGGFSLEGVPAGSGQLFVVHPITGAKFWDIAVVANDTITFDYTFPYAVPPVMNGVVRGRVTRSGTPQKGIVVSGPMGIGTTTDSNGRYELAGLPVDRPIGLGFYQKTTSLGGLSFTIPSASPLLTGMDLILAESVHIYGTLLDHEGNGVPFTPIYKSDPWNEVRLRPVTETNSRGEFEIEEFELNKNHTYSAAVAPNIASAQVSVNSDDIFGFILQERGTADLRVRLVDFQGNPQIGYVVLESDVPVFAPDSYGQAGHSISHQGLTQADGWISLKNINAGTIQVHGIHPQFGETQVLERILVPQPEGAPAEEITLAFAGTETANLFGTVYDPSGNPVGQGVWVQAQVNGISAKALTSPTGQYAFESLVSGNLNQTVHLNVFDPISGAFQWASVSLNEGLNFREDVYLQGVGDVQVRIEDHEGAAVDYAAITIEYSAMDSVPPEPPATQGEIMRVRRTVIQQITPSQQSVLFENLPAGLLTIRANAGNGLVGLREVALPHGADPLDVLVRLEAGSSISGIFVDGSQMPIPNAEIQLKQNGSVLSQILSSALGGAEGTFLFENWPMRTYQLKGTDPSSARIAQAEVTTSPFQPNPHVVLSLDPLGHVRGIVYNEDLPLEGARVTIRGRQIEWVTGTDPSGAYSFRNLPLGTYTVHASKNGLLPEAESQITVQEPDADHILDLYMEPTKSLRVTILDAYGQPAPGAEVNVYKGSNQILVYGDTRYADADGRVVFPNLVADTYQVRARDYSEDLEVLKNVTIGPFDPDPLDTSLQFPGFGEVFGTVRFESGEIPDHNLTVQIEVGYRNTISISTNNLGQFHAIRIPIQRSVPVRVYDPDSRGTAQETIFLDNPGQSLEINLTLLNTTYVTGHIELADGSPASYAEVRLTQPFALVTQANYLGEYLLEPVPTGPFTIQVRDPETSRSIAQAGEILNDANGFPIPGELDFTFGGVADITGFATLSDGEPVRFGDVFLEPQVGGSTLRVPLQGDGRYLFQYVPLGPYRIRAYDRYLDVYRTWETVFISDDGVTVNKDLPFANSYNLSGIVTLADGVSPAFNGTVELWKVSTQGRLILVYHSAIDDLGHYLINHIYPGDYTLKAYDEFQNATVSLAFTMLTSDATQDLQLVESAALVGSISDGTAPFTSGTIAVTQNGATIQHTLNSSGQFVFEGLVPGPCSIHAVVAQGWYEVDQSITLVGGSNSIQLMSEPTLNVLGQAYMVRVPVAKPQVRFFHNQKWRTVSTNASGDFVLDRAPHNTDLLLEVAYGSKIRQWTVSTADQDLTVGPFVLDLTPPEILFDQDDMTVTTWPFPLNISISEPDAGSANDPSTTQIWVNQIDMTAFFNVDANGLTADWQAFPPGFVFGPNAITVSSRNDSGAQATAQFNLNVAVSEIGLWLSLNENGSPVGGTFSLDGSAVNSIGEQGLLIPGLVPGTHALKAWSGVLGHRDALVLGALPSHGVAVPVGPTGSYSGMVLDPDGLPVSAAILQIGPFLETSQPDGSYLFDLLALQNHAIAAQKDDLLGYVEAPALSSNGEIQNLDLQLEASGRVSGLVLDDDGLTPIESAEVSLTIPGKSSFFDRTALSASDGSFQLDQVLKSDGQLQAYDPLTDRYGYATTTWLDETELMVNIQLAPAGDVLAVVLDADNQPLTNSAFEISGTRTVNGTTDANGQLSALNLPFGSYHLRIERQDLFQYFELDFNLNQDALDLGSLTLLRDVAPQITVFALPASHDPLAPLPIDLDATDDRGLVSWQLDLNGLVLGGDLNGTSVQETLMVALPDLPVGTYPYTFEVADVWGQTAVESGNLNLIHDATGPVLSQIEPAADSHYFELSQVITRVTAVDDQGVDRVEFALLGTATQGSDSRSPYTYGFYLPQVSVATNYTLQITAYDRRGNSSQVDVNLIVDPVTTTGEPDVTLYAPLDGQPLPLFLPQGLDLQIHFAMSDPDKIGGYRLTFNDLVLLEHIYGNTTTYPVDTHLVLPTELRSAEMLVGQLEVWDRGGQTRVIPITIPNINGQVETQLVLGPNQAQGNESYILVGGNHIIDGRNTVQNLVLVNGATLTQTATDEFETHVAGTQLKVLGVLVVDEGCLIDGNGKGFNQLPSAMGISEPHSSHAGLGYGSTDPNEIYGSPFQPSLPGSFTGGGAWQLTSDQIWLLGEIRANGLYQSGSPAFNGSGGSIWLQAEAFHGLGAVRALGYSYGSGRAGGGGRIALYGDFAGKVEAFSFGPTGTGTIYRSVPDPDQPGQRINTLQIRHRDDASSSIPTYLFGPWTLQEDSDFTVREEVMGSDTFQVLTLLAPFGPYQGLPGYLVAFQTAETSIAQQVGLELWSPANQPFGTFVGGETIEIRPPLDAIQVENYGYLNLLDYSPQVDIYLGHLGVLQSESTYVSSGHLLDLSGTCRLIGNFQWDNLTHSSDLKLALTGSATVQNWNQTDGEVYADGSIQADVLTVASAAKIRTQHINGAELTLHSRLMDIQGTVSAPRSGLAVASGPTFRSHGGLGDGTETYGSLYRAESRGNGASYGGGLLTLLADESLVVDGVISSKTEESNGSGGSIHIRTPFFNGTGTLNADGFFSSSKPCGGGRIAIFSNTYAFSGSVHAYGLGYVSGTSYQSGAGTIFIQSDQWPNGRLIVDNGGYQPGMNRSTPLPGLGSRLADAATGLAQILGSNFPDSLAGLYVVSGNNPPARIASNTADTLSPETSFPAIGAGEEYHGLHRLDVLEVRGKAHLYSIDPIEVLDQLIINDGTLEVPQLQMDQPLVLKDGKGRLISPVSDLTLDNFDLVIDQPVNMDTLTLVNGSSLTYRQPIVITTIMVSDSDLIAAVPGHDPGLIAQDLTLINSGWTVANRPTASSFYELVAQIDGTLLIDTNSEIASSGSNKTPSSAFEWPTGVAYATETHGGFNRLGNHANYPTGYAEEPVFGNYVRPLRPGPQNGGGVIHLVANQIENQGMIQSDAPAFNYRSGGSVLLEVNTLVGNGTIAAREGSSGGGGGRIAIHYQGSDAFKTSMSLTTQKVGDQGITTRGGAGTIFLKGPGQTYGELVIDQTGSRIGTEDGLESRQRLTGIPGHSRITLSIEDNGPANQISDPAWELAPDLAFQWIRLTYDGQTYQRQIVDNSYTGLMLSEDLPKPIPAGTELELILKLDALTLKGGALLFYPGLIETAALNLGPEMNTGNGVWCRDLIGLPNPLVINSERLLLSLEEPQWQTQDITVQNGILVLAKPLEVHDLNLVDGFVTQSLVNMAYAANHLFEPALELTAHQITFSGSSRIDANGKVYKNTLFGNSGTHGGLPSNGSGTTFGSLYQPQEYGNRQSYFSGGRVHVIANTIQNGVFAANGDRSSGNGAGGSIWIEAQTLIGDLQCDASSDSIGRDGGGRIAVYAGTTDGAILTNTSGYGGSSGTAFIHIADQHTFGELRIVNSTVTSVPTPILGFAPTTVPAGFSATFVDGITSITLPGLSETNDLSGYRLIPRNDPASAARVLSNSTSGDLQIVVEGDVSDL
ncbi:MAG: carboxypeptidase regulatory-like domain-containing protein [Acidobacteria bacterium]|nr:carboxypeptidase regulatory-like domain-containing protein [Acidobacteriota bacterium]